MVYDATANALIEGYAVHCPVTEGDFESGFRWEYLSHKCYELLHPYCGARTTLPSAYEYNFFCRVSPKCSYEAS
jgi:hypothetical protein